METDLYDFDSFVCGIGMLEMENDSSLYGIEDIETAQDCMFWAEFGNR